MRLKSTFLILLFFIHCATSNAQTGTIAGSVTGSGAFVTDATVSLLQAADSSWIRSEFTDDKGKFRFGGVLTGEYIISVSFIGFATSLKKVLIKEKGNEDLAIELQKQDGILNEVSVTAKRPFIEMNMGKITVNIEGSAIASGNALDLLKRLPGVTVNQEGAISMNGKQGVLVLINDRPTYLEGEQLADYLRTITADEIAQLELITQPGAKYDATGNTGIINFKMKHNRKAGLNGNASLTVGHGVYANAHGNLQVNYRNDKLNVQFTANDYEGKGFGDRHETQHSLATNTGIITSTNDIHAAAWERFGVGATQLAADYNCTEHTTIGTSLRASYHPNTYYGYTTSTNTDNATGNIVYNNVMNPDGFIRKDVTTNAYFTHKFSKENVLDINVDYLAYGNYTRQDVISYNYDAMMHPLADSQILHSRQPTLINVLSVKADHTYTFGNGIKLESGLKSSYVTTDNNSIASIMQNSTWIDDTLRSNRFVYHEQINAAYASAGKSIGKKWTATFGLRAEQTITQGIQYVHDSSFNRQYASLFPTTFINYKADSNNLFELNYGRRIDRPSYRWLNPFIRYTFQYNYAVGNPYLLPQYTNNIELKHSFKNMLITTLSYSETTDVINNILATDNNNQLYTTHKNIASFKMADCNVVFNKDLWKWCSVNISGYVGYVVFSGIANNVQTTNKGVPYSFHFNIQADLGKGWKVATDGYFEHGTVASLIEVYGSQLYTEFGVSKKIKNNMLVRLSVNDPLYVCRLYAHTRMDNFRSDAVFRNDTRMALLEFNYSFGSNKAGRDKKNTLDETNRIR